MVILKRREELHIMRQAGRIVAEVLALLEERLRPGVTTGELDRLAETWIRQHGATPSFLGYPPGARHPFPASICASVNDELVHGIPGTRVLHEGDIITLDVGVCYNGFHGDAARTFPVGTVSAEAASLLAVTAAALEAGQAQARPGQRLGDISHAVQTVAESQGYYLTRQYSGHGIGRQLHEAPQILNVGAAGRGVLLAVGMTLCIEPMLLIGTAQTRVLENEWTVVSANGALTAHFENTLAVVEGEPEILTRL
ncbi:MAG TPA: type I methionyl aminopeptidase [Anaerolineae bacterium]|nr:type I methionyl aminopeptidase [Anaerolineae bacterium]